MVVEIATHRNIASSDGYSNGKNTCHPEYSTAGYKAALQNIKAYACYQVKISGPKQNILIL